MKLKLLHRGLYPLKIDCIEYNCVFRGCQFCDNINDIAITILLPQSVGPVGSLISITTALASLAYISIGTCWSGCCHFLLPYLTDKLYFLQCPVTRHNLKFLLFPTQPQPPWTLLWSHDTTTPPVPTALILIFFRCCSGWWWQQLLRFRGKLWENLSSTGVEMLS